MEVNTTFKDSISASDAVEENIGNYIRYSNNELLPNTIDGLKLVQRRILSILGTSEERLKCAAVVGRVMDKLHPHGDAGIEDALVRLGQPFSQVHPLVTIKGNYGDYGGGAAAAGRYLDVESGKFARDLFFNKVDNSTLTIIPSETGRGTEIANFIPVVPTTLLMGTFAVSTAFKSVIPHFNLKDVCNFVQKFIELNEQDSLTLYKHYADIAKYCLPDFPVDLLLRNRKELLATYSMGNFDQRICADGTMEIYPTEIRLLTVPFSPFAKVIEKVGPMMNSANFLSANFTEVKDLTTGTLRGNLLFKLKRGVDPFTILEEFKKLVGFTSTLTPKWVFVDIEGYVHNLNPLQLVQLWYNERYRSIMGHFKYLTRKLFEQCRKYEALVIIADHTDEVLKIFKESSNQEETVPKLRQQFKLSRDQAVYIASLKLSQITRQGKDELIANLNSVRKQIEELNTTYKNIDTIILDDAAYIKKEYGDKCKRRTKIPQFMGALYLEQSKGVIQFSDMKELIKYFKLWNKHQPCHIILYPEGVSYKGIVNRGGVVVDDFYDHPKEFKADQLLVSKYKPRSTIILRDHSLSRVDKIVVPTDGALYAMFGKDIVVIKQNYTVEKLPSIAVTKRLTPQANGIKSDVIYFNGVTGDDIIVATANTSMPNMVTFERIAPGKRLVRQLTGKVIILGMWATGDKISITLPNEVLARCPTKHLIISDPISFMGNETLVKVHMNKRRTSREQQLHQLYKGIDILTDIPVKGDKTHEE